MVKKEKKDKCCNYQVIAAKEQILVAFLSLDQSFSPVLPSSTLKIFRVEETKTVSDSEKLLLHARVYL